MLEDDDALDFNPNDVQVSSSMLDINLDDGSVK
jgi:hypothetical protein